MTDDTDEPGRPGDSDDTSPDLERTPARSHDDEDNVDFTAGSEATEQVEIALKKAAPAPKCRA